MRLFSAKIDSTKSLWDAPNVLLQKFPAPTFMATTKFTFSPNDKLENEKVGLTIMGLSYAHIALKSKKDGVYLVYSVCTNANKGTKEKETVLQKKDPKKPIYFRVVVKEGGVCRFSYSLDGAGFTDVGEDFTATVGQWIGAKVGLFLSRETQTNDSGFADFDWFRVEKVE